MTYDLLFRIMADAKLSPEQFGKQLGIAGLTLRRWQKLPPGESVGKKYQTVLVDAVQRMITAGRLPPDAPSVKEIYRDNGDLSIAPALANLGVTFDDLREDGRRPEALVQLLTRIGMSEDRQEQVRHGHRSLATFQRLGAEWKEKIAYLVKVVKDDRLSLAEKLVAYGALFYLITPFDLIPDHIPVIGFLDDFAFLVIAAGYYARHYAKLAKA